jgi:hypothetical protein
LAQEFSQWRTLALRLSEIDRDPACGRAAWRPVRLNLFAEGSTYLKLAELVLFFVCRVGDRSHETRLI